MKEVFVRDMSLYTYILTRDYGFAPNPFPPYCTLATCKPRIRASAKIGDWVTGIGSGAQKSNMKNKMIFAMHVEDKLTFDEYWLDKRFKYKKPVMNGSKFQNYGDNVYHTDPKTREIIQEDSHHSLPGGEINYENYPRDISGKYVLISKEYWYFGKDAPVLPEELIVLANVVRNHKKYNDEQLINCFSLWLKGFSDKGYIGMPFRFSKNFERYDGK